MPSNNLNDIRAFVTVARERSFTRAAAKLAGEKRRDAQVAREVEFALPEELSGQKRSNSRASSKLPEAALETRDAASNSHFGTESPQNPPQLRKISDRVLN
jgi:hypothetical protein